MGSILNLPSSVKTKRRPRKSTTVVNYAKMMRTRERSAHYKSRDDFFSSGDGGGGGGQVTAITGRHT